MRDYCTLGDTKYLPHIICLLKSMRACLKHDYTVHILCLDENVYSTLNRVSDSSVKLIRLSEVEEDFQIRSVKYLPAGTEAISNATASGKDPSHVQYCWALAPCIILWLLERLQRPITYVDSDIMFFGDMEDFFTELGDRPIGFVRHRIPYLQNSGEFNVGIVHFSPHRYGLACARRWRDMMMSNNHNYQIYYGTCGDQKYLEALRAMYYSDVAVVDKTFGHLAPWNVTQHQYIDGDIIWDGRRQKLAYFHFAHFNMSPDRKSYKTSYKNEWIWGEPLEAHAHVKELYDHYYSSMCRAHEEMSS